MNRSDSLEKLHSIGVKVNLTVLPSEGSLECLYYTSEGYKEEWIGINEWPVSQKKDPEGRIVYCVKIDGKRHRFRVYANFVAFFVQYWIGAVTSWEECSDEELEAYLEWIEDLEEGIPCFE